jgi:V-type H+-transporting ATPase subunit a
MAFAGRYVLFMMGLFATYCGLIYNDFMSLPFTHFPSMWEESGSINNTDLVRVENYTYPFGIDYHWYVFKNLIGTLKHKKRIIPRSAHTHTPTHPPALPQHIRYHTKNELVFLNSVKMKLAVILGVIHMSFGIILSLLNHLHRKDMISVFFEFIPQMLFLWCTFGYMILIIIYKWTVDWTLPGTALSSCVL